MGKSIKYLFLVVLVSSFVFGCSRAPLEEFADAKAAIDAARKNAGDCVSQELLEAEKAYKEAQELLDKANKCSPNPIVKSTANNKAYEPDPTCIPQSQLYKQIREKLLYAKSKAEEAQRLGEGASKVCSSVKARLAEVNDEILSIKQDLIAADRVRDLNMLMDKYNEVEGYLMKCNCSAAQSSLDELIAMLDKIKEELAAGFAPVKETTGDFKNYTVKRGDCLWRISKREYLNPFMWPLIYWANKASIKDPDLIFPGQIFKIRQDYKEGEKSKAIDFSKHRGPWSLFDGK